MTVITEIATVLARGYIRLLATQFEKAHSDDVFQAENRPNSLDSRAKTRPPWVVTEVRRT